MFRLPLPPNKAEFNNLLAKCSNVPVEFDTFTIQPDMTITCRFNFNMQWQKFVVVSFIQLKQFDPDLLQKRLSSLKFFFTVPYSHLTFAVLNTRYKFIYNGSISSYITDGGQSYTTFLANNPTSSNTQTSSSTLVPSIQQPAQNLGLSLNSLEQTVLTPHQPTPPVNTIQFNPHHATFNPYQATTPVNPIQPTTPVRASSSLDSRAQLLTALKSRLALQNINHLKQSFESAVAANPEANLTVNSEQLIGRLMKNTNWTNKDLGLLLLAVNGVIPLSVEPTEQQAPPPTIGEVIEENSDLD